MQIQEIFLKASEFYGENGFFDLEDKEFEFLLNRIINLNNKKILSSREIKEAKGMFAIFLYSDKEICLKNLNLNKRMEALLKKVLFEFCG